MYLCIKQTGQQCPIKPKKMKNIERMNENFVEAARCGRLERVKELLIEGVDPNCDEGDALQWAVENGDAEMVQIMLDYGADPKVFKGLAIDIAIEHGYLGLKDLLLKYW